MKKTPERSLTILLAAAMFGVSLGACTPPQGPPHRPEPEPVAPPESAPPPKDSAPDPASTLGVGVGPRALPPDPRTPTVDIEDAGGKPKKGPDEALGPVRQQMKECTGGRTGVVRVRVKSEKSHTSMDIEPGSGLDGTVHRCVLESLSTVDVDDVLGRGSPSDRGSPGFTSVLRVEW